MSYTLYTDGDTYLGDLATNRGLDDLSSYVDGTSYKSLAALLEYGSSDEIVSLKEEVRAAIASNPPSTVVDTLKGLKEMLERAEDTVTIVS